MTLAKVAEIYGLTAVYLNELAPQRSRDNLLNNVYSGWIEGFLHPALAIHTELHLDKVFQPEAV